MFTVLVDGMVVGECEYSEVAYYENSGCRCVRKVAQAVGGNCRLA